MKIAIIGAGNLGSALAKHLVPAGHEVTLSFSLDAAKLAADAADLGAKSASVADAVREADVAVLTAPWGAVEAALSQAGSLDGKILWDCTVPLTADFSGLAIGTTTSAGEEVARMAPGARVVKGVPPAAELLHAGVPAGATKPSVFLCSADAAAKSIVGELVLALGAEPIDAGPLATARYTEPIIMLIIQLAYGQKLGGKIGTSLIRYT